MYLGYRACWGIAVPSMPTVLELGGPAIRPIGCWLASRRRGDASRGSVGGLGRYGLRVSRGNKDVFDGQTESCPQRDIGCGSNYNALGNDLQCEDTCLGMGFRPRVRDHPPGFDRVASWDARVHANRSRNPVWLPFRHASSSGAEMGRCVCLAVDSSTHASLTSAAFSGGGRCTQPLSGCQCTGTSPCDDLRFCMHQAAITSSFVLTDPVGENGCGSVFALSCLKHSTVF